MSTRFDLPVVDGSTAEYWAAAREHRLLLTRCRECSAVIFYPRPFCPACHGDSVEWVQASGRATLYSYSIVRHNDLPPFDRKVPYVAAIVDLEEGPRMVSNLVGIQPDQVRIGMELEVEFEELTEEITLPVFGVRK